MSRAPWPDNSANTFSRAVQDEVVREYRERYPDVSLPVAERAGGEVVTPFRDVSTYNNYYEFGTDKGDPAENAHTLKTTPWTGCVEARKGDYDTDDTAPSTGPPDTLFTPYFAPAEPTRTGKMSPVSIPSKRP